MQYLIDGEESFGVGMMNERISVIIPVYNVERYIREAIESVLRQTYTKWELLLVDDGSTDNSGKICDEYTQKYDNIHVFHVENGGLSYARNIGMDHAAGEWILFLDGDDYLEPEALAVLRSYSDGVDIVVCGLREFPRMREYRCTTDVCTYPKFADMTEQIEHLYNNGIISACTKLYRRKSICVRFDESVRHTEDLLFSLEYLPRCRGIRVIPDILFNYRVIRGELTLSKRFWMDQLDIFEKAIQLVHDDFSGDSNMEAYFEKRFAYEICKYFTMFMQIKTLSKAEKLMYISLKLEKKAISSRLKPIRNMSAGNRILWNILCTRNTNWIYYGFRFWGRRLL